jgi:hypothetical protein
MSDVSSVSIPKPSFDGVVKKIKHLSLIEFADRFRLCSSINGTQVVYTFNTQEEKIDAYKKATAKMKDIIEQSVKKEKIVYQDEYVSIIEDDSKDDQKMFILKNKRTNGRQVFENLDEASASGAVIADNCRKFDEIIAVADSDEDENADGLSSIFTDGAGSGDKFSSMF